MRIIDFLVKAAKENRIELYTYDSARIVMKSSHYLTLDRDIRNRYLISSVMGKRLYIACEYALEYVPDASNKYQFKVMDNKIILKIRMPEGYYRYIRYYDGYWDIYHKGLVTAGIISEYRMSPNVLPYPVVINPIYESLKKSIHEYRG